jgi:uncharacterized protein (DUF2062 family)
MALKLLEEKVLKPIRGLLSQGVTPKKMSQALAAGFVLGMTPMLGISTVLAVLVAAVFKLNQVAIQVANYAAYPAQIVMFVPFIRLGEWVFGLEPAAINPSDIATMFSDDFQASVQLYGQSLLAGWLSWLIAAVPLALVIRWPAEELLIKYFARSEVRDEEP